MPEHIGCYHAVGQGQFFSGRLMHGEAVGFSYIVDCGSMGNTRKLYEEIQQFKDSIDKELDLLFISHLHLDHFNGIGKLKGMKIDTIILPYLEPWARLSLYLSEKNRSENVSDEHNKQVIDFIIEPITALRNMDISVNRIIYVRSDDKGENHDQDSNINPEGEHLPKNIQTESAIKTEEICISYDELNSKNLFSDRKENINILNFKLFRLAINPTNLDDFLDKKVNNQKIRELRTEDIKSILNDPKLYKVWQNYYKEINRHINDTGLCLSVTTNLMACNLFCKKGYLRSRNCRCLRLNDCMCRCDIKEKFGYLFTGDLSLNNIGVFNQFENRYKYELDKVQIFTIPHHGARSSWNLKLLSLVGPAVFVASSGYNSSYSHPHFSVVADIFNDHRNSFIWVNEFEPLKIKTRIYGWI